MAKNVLLTNEATIGRKVKEAMLAGRLERTLTKEQILEELPAKVETDIYLDLTEHQKMLYRRTVESVKTTIEAAYRSRTAAQASAQFSLPPMPATAAGWLGFQNELDPSVAKPVAFRKARVDSMIGSSSLSL